MLHQNITVCKAGNQADVNQNVLKHKNKANSLKILDDEIIDIDMDTAVSKHEDEQYQVQDNILLRSYQVSYQTLKWKYMGWKALG